MVNRLSTAQFKEVFYLAGSCNAAQLWLRRTLQLPVFICAHFALYRLLQFPQRYTNERKTAYSQGTYCRLTSKGNCEMLQLLCSTYF